mgnify:CR=1 FL=1
MNTNPRQLLLLEEVRARKSATVEQLADTLGVTLQTVRRDVQRLADAGLLLRFHGGVSLPRETPTVAAWKERQAVQADAKARIARSVAAAIPEGSSLMMGVGTTVEAVARELLNKPGLQVITDNLHVAGLLSEHPDCKVHVAGGMLRGRDRALEGDSTVAYLQQFKVDICIVTALGIDPEQATIFVQSHVPEHAQLAWIGGIGLAVDEIYGNFGAIAKQRQAEAADPVRIGGLVGEVGKLFRKGRNDAQKPVCHGRMGYKVAAPNTNGFRDQFPARPSYAPRRLHGLRPRCRS